jgi:hypothetical protein
LRFNFEAIDITNARAKVAIWSIGQNGVDEHGKGDDIIFNDVIGAPEILGTFPK